MRGATLEKVSKEARKEGRRLDWERKPGSEGKE